LLNLGANLVDLGDTENAITIFRRMVKELPDLQPGWNNLGNALVEAGRPQEAISFLEKAIAMAPALPDAYSNLARACNEIGRNQDAIENAQKAVKCNPNFMPALIQWGRALLELGEPAAARKVLVSVIQTIPSAWPALALLGTCAEQMGELEESIAIWMDCIRQKPDHAPVLGQIVARMKSKTPEAIINQMQLLLENKATKQSDREHLAYGLAHFFDAKGKFDSAVKYLDQFSLLRQSGFQARPLEYHADSFAERCRKIDVVAGQMQSVQESLPNQLKMIFITGMPRAGTTLLEQILSSHSQVKGVGEVTWFPEIMQEVLEKAELTPELAVTLRHKYHDRLAKSGTSAAWIIDKLPDNFYYLPVLRKVFPEAHFLICRRDDRDTALSQRFTRFARVRWNSDWGLQRGRFEIFHERLRKIIAEKSENVRIVRYESLVANIQVEVEPLLHLMGLSWQEKCLDFQASLNPVKTASAAQVRQPVYKSSVGRFQKYNFAYEKEFHALNEMQKETERMLQS
jgi:tetratricopeptide (TPR) repeat protein